MLGVVPLLEQIMWLRWGLILIDKRLTYIEVISPSENILLVKSEFLILLRYYHTCTRTHIQVLQKIFHYTYTFL